MYSFFCKQCGDSFSSNDKQEVARYRKDHKLETKTLTQTFKQCRLTKTLRETLARPSLSVIINQEEKEKQIA